MIARKRLSRLKARGKGRVGVGWMEYWTASEEAVQYLLVDVLDDILNSLVAGGFQFAVGAERGIGLAMKAAVENE